MSQSLSLLQIEHTIRIIRNCRIMLDQDLALLYGVETRSLIQAIKRNIERFPEDFMFQVTDSEVTLLRSQNVISRAHGGRRLRKILATHADLAKKLEDLEHKYDSQFRSVFDAIRELMKPQTPPTRKIGFSQGDE